ncbi:MAG: hypothetical protein Q8R47_04900, partial [Nanoarchaeota archaeon]|nr:hypothetical protein [Nanoarchaeota archaeon]
MKKWIIIAFFLFCLYSVFVSAENSGNQTTTISLTPNVDKTLYLNTKYTSLFKLEITSKKPCSPKDTVSVFYNISKDNALIKEDSFSKEMGCTTSASTGEFIPAEVGNYTLCGMISNSSVMGDYSSSPLSCTEFEVIDTSEISCDIRLQLNTNETIFYENSQSIEFKPELSDRSFPFVIEYWIEDLFGNMVKPKLNTTNTNEKSWKTNIKEQDRVLFLKAIVYPDCDDLDLSSNAAEEMFIVTKNETTLSASEEVTTKDSSIEIIKITPEKVSFGESLNAEIEIYKGDTGKYSVSLWVEKDGKVISEKTKIHLKEKDTQYRFTVPVLLEPNCKEKIKEGDAQLMIEGLGLQEEKEFVIDGLNNELCPEKEEGSEKSEKKSTKTEKVKEQTKSANQSLFLLSQADNSQ